MLCSLGGFKGVPGGFMKFKEHFRGVPRECRSMSGGFKKFQRHSINIWMRYRGFPVVPGGFWGIPEIFKEFLGCLRALQRRHKGLEKCFS